MKYCFIIPNYNHIFGFDTLLSKLQEFELPIFVINDASTEDVREQLEILAKQYENVHLSHHQKNKGKGGAVKTGLALAYQQGFDYGIQIDADGQHDLEDIKRFLAESKEHPSALISGAPVYDQSIPKVRYYARYITHFWVCVETLSMQLKDTMCGYRIYPLKQCHKLMTSVDLGERMDFDIEIMVRLYWQGVDCKFIDTKVIYPEHGSSHFRALEDNLKISWLHTRLCLGMLIRSPALIARNVKRWCS